MLAGARQLVVPVLGLPGLNSSTQTTIIGRPVPGSFLRAVFFFAAFSCFLALRFVASCHSQPGFNFCHQLHSTFYSHVKMPYRGNSDILQPDVAQEAKTHKLKRLVQSPNSFFMDVRCQGCVQMYVPLTTLCCSKFCVQMFENLQLLDFVGVFVPLMCAYVTFP